MQLPGDAADGRGHEHDREDAAPLGRPHPVPHLPDPARAQGTHIRYLPRALSPPPSANAPFAASLLFSSSLHLSSLHTFALKHSCSCFLPAKSVFWQESIMFSLISAVSALGRHHPSRMLSRYASLQTMETALCPNLHITYLRVQFNERVLWGLCAFSSADRIESNSQGASTASLCRQQPASSSAYCLSLYLYSIVNTLYSSSIVKFTLLYCTIAILLCGSSSASSRNSQSPRLATFQILTDFYLISTRPRSDACAQDLKPSNIAVNEDCELKVCLCERGTRSPVLLLSIVSTFLLLHAN